MIAVMGPTGTGKSALIKLLTKDQDIKVGHGVSSETNEIKLANYFEPDGRCVTFVDTPGFDDSREGVTDADILQQIAAFLKTEYTDGRKLNGVIYLHRITDPRMGGVSARNLRMFKKLCGSDSLRNVAIVTTRWDDFKGSKLIAVKREKELMSDPSFFQPLVEEGAQFFRHDGTLESAHQIVLNLLENDPIVLQIQEELASGKSVLDTEAGSELDKHVRLLVEKHRKDMERVQLDIKEAITEKNQVLLKHLEQERLKLNDELGKWQGEQRLLQTSWGDYMTKALNQQEDAKRHLEEQRSSFLDQFAADLKEDRQEIRGLINGLEKERHEARKERDAERERRQREIVDDQARRIAEINQKLGEERETAAAARAEAERTREQLAESRAHNNILQAELQQEKRIRAEAEAEVRKERQERNNERDQRMQEAIAEQERAIMVRAEADKNLVELRVRIGVLQTDLQQEKRSRTEEGQRAQQAYDQLMSELNAARSKLQEEVRNRERCEAEFERQCRIHEEEKTRRQTEEQELVSNLTKVMVNMGRDAENKIKAGRLNTLSELLTFVARPMVLSCLVNLVDGGATPETAQTPVRHTPDISYALEEFSPID